MSFVYKAVSESGSIVNGKSPLSKREDLIASLKKQHLRPVSIRSDRSGLSFLTGDINPKVKIQDLVIFTRQLSTMISAGVPLARSLSALAADSESPALRTVMENVVKDVESGKSLGESFEKHPKIFSEVFVNMIKAGEEGGILDEILKKLASQIELDASIRKKIKSAMMYPTVILVVTIVGFFGIMLFIVPKIGSIMTSLGGPNAKLPIYTRALLAISNFCVAPSFIRFTHIYTLVHFIPIIGNYAHYINDLPNLILLGILAGIGFFYLLKYIKTDNGRIKYDEFMLRVPVIKTIVLKITVARFSRTFASLMGAGVSVLDALDVTGKALGNKVFQNELKIAAVEVQNGQPLSEQLANAKHFPPIVAQMLLVGEETGQIDKVLVKIADFYEEEVDVLINGLASIIEPIMIIIMGAAVGLIAASVMGPIADLSKVITPTSGFSNLIKYLHLFKLWL